jgi:hypothetical protein
MTGRRFGLRVVLGFAGFKGRFAAWLVQCKCGRLSVLEGAVLHRRGGCGCSVRLSPAAKKLRPLLSEIVARCHNPANKSYPRYGGRGITVCKKWRKSPEAFASDVGPRPSPSHVLVRRDLGRGYTPSNCYWGTKADILSRSGTLITCNGTTQNLSRWAAQLGISREAMRLRVKRRLEQGLDVSAAINRPPKLGRPRKTDR